MEVPEFVQFAFLFQQQTVDAPTPQAARGVFGSFQGFLPRQDYSLVAEQNVDIPVSQGRCGRAGRGGLQGLSQGQNSRAFGAAEHVDIPVPRGGASSHLSGAVDEAFTRLFFFFCTFPQHKKKCQVGSPLGVGTGRGLAPWTPAAYGVPTLSEPVLEAESEEEDPDKWVGRIRPQVVQVGGLPREVVLARYRL